MTAIAEDIIIRNLKPDEIGIPIEWARQEGWNPGIHDGSCHYAVDPAGWFCAEKDGEVIGVVAGTNYDELFSFWGFYIVRPEHRGQGIGWTMFQQVLDHVGDRNFGCDGVYAMQDLYTARVGMKYAYRNIRWQGIARVESHADLIPASDLPFTDLLLYDTAHFPTQRESFLKQWIHQPEGTALVHTDRKGAISGYGVIRRCFEGHKIGPLFADTPLIADEIYKGLVSTVPGETVFFDTPEPNSDAVRMATGRGMVEVFGTARMYTQKLPELPLHEIFGVTTFELG